jgi:hypothetical protein
VLGVVPLIKARLRRIESNNPNSRIVNEVSDLRGESGGGVERLIGFSM